MNLESNVYESIDKCLVCNSTNIGVQISNIVHTCGICKTIGYQDSMVSSSVYQCNDCKHSFLSPRLLGSAITHYYNKLNSEYFDTPPSHSRIKEDAKIVEKVKSIKSNGKVLEIGCGNGFLLNLFHSQGYETYGIEPSPKAADFAVKSLNLKVKNGFLDSKTFPDLKFDIILLMDVIEHLYEPNEMIKLCQEYLSPSGVLIILTGNIDSINAKIWKEKWFYFYSWEHISFFNKKSISILLGKHNFKLFSYESICHSGGFFNNLFTLIVKNYLIYFYNFWLKKKYKHSNLAFDHMLVIGQK